ncbi:MAG TPA: mechanosensitive ion channel family protein [Polyangiales bacterium]|nr:mechanosensitive ion channel family protein [Polyangiales bacterium]
MDLNHTIENLLPLATSYGLRVLGVVVAIWLSFSIARWLQHRVTRGLRRRNFDETLSIFFGSLLRWLTLVAAIVACLGVFGIETTSFAAILGAAGLAIGLAFQGTLSNFAAGVMLLVFRPFKVGDYVVAGGKEGTVAEIGLFVTAIDTPDNRRLYVPNTAIGAGPIENWTEHPVRRVDVTVNIAASEDLDKTRQALENAAAAVPSRDSRDSQIFLKGFDAGMVSWQVRVWSAPARYWDVWQETVRAVGYELTKANIARPTPSMNVVVSGALPALAEGAPESIPPAAPLPAAH